jgi:hypothetical protein
LVFFLCFLHSEIEQDVGKFVLVRKHSSKAQKDITIENDKTEIALRDSSYAN